MKTKSDFFGIAFSEVMCGVIVAIGQIVFSKILSTKIKSALICGIVAAVIAIILAVTVGSSLQRFFLKRSKTSKRRRLKAFEIAKYEGKWIEQLNNNEYAICTLEYNMENDRYIFRGRHYSNNSKKTDFISENVIYDKGRLHYITNGTNVPDNDIKGLVPCYGRIEMVMSNQGLSSSGEFMDIIDKSPLVPFSMQQIDKKMLYDFFNEYDKSIKKKRAKLEAMLETEDVGLAFIEWYSKNYKKYK
ncbi:MAG: hypothetical protein IJL87_09595 [Clostridia bacterium]|nr:hypothetical protein [Clostridia bacterium]